MNAWLLRFGYLAVFFGVLLENAGVPVPGETMLLAAAALAAHHRLSAIEIAVVAVAAAILGDNAGFLIGRRGGRPLLERWVERLHAERLLVRLDAFFDRFGPGAVFIARFVPGIRVLGALFAGAARSMPWRRFFLFNALGAIAWVTWIVAVGYYGLLALERFLGTSGVVTGVLVALAVTGVVLVVWRVVEFFRPTPNKPEDQ